MNMSSKTLRSITVFLFAGLIFSIPTFAQSNDRDVLRDRIDMLISTHEATVEGEPT